MDTEVCIRTCTVCKASLAYIIYVGSHVTIIM